jgi:hypothetical protein
MDPEQRQGITGAPNLVDVTRDYLKGRITYETFTALEEKLTKHTSTRETTKTKKLNKKPKQIKP